MPDRRNANVRLGGGAISVSYEGQEVAEEVSQLNLQGLGFSGVTDAGDGVVNISVPNTPAGDIGYYIAADCEYDSSAQRLQFNIPSLTSQPVPSFLFCIFPSVIERSRTGFTLARINDFSAAHILDRRGRDVVPSQITPGELYQVLWLLGGGGRYFFVVDLEPRPQDYLIWTGFTDVDGDTYTAANFTLSFGSQPLTAPSAPQESGELLIAVPVNTGDLTFVSFGVEEGNVLNVFSVIADPITLGGVPCKVVKTRFAGTSFASQTLYTRQEQP